MHVHPGRVPSRARPVAVKGRLGIPNRDSGWHSQGTRRTSSRRRSQRLPPSGRPTSPPSFSRAQVGSHRSAYALSFRTTRPNRTGNSHSSSSPRVTAVAPYALLPRTSRPLCESPTRRSPINLGPYTVHNQEAIMGRKTTPGAGHRRDHAARNVQPKGHDPYRSEAKPADSMVCDDCGVVCHGGKWYWGAPPLGVEHGGSCPACRRIRDHYPAGTVLLHSAPEAVRQEILAMIHHAEAAEKGEHALERLMAIEADGEDLRITTTGLHLARAIGSALRRRFHTGVSIRYLEEDHIVLVEWRG